MIPRCQSRVWMLTLWSICTHIQLSIRGLHIQLSGHVLLYLYNSEYRGSRGANPPAQARGLISRVNNTHRLDISLISVSITMVFKKRAPHTDKQMKRDIVFTLSLCRPFLVFLSPSARHADRKLCSFNCLELQYVLSRAMNTPRVFMCFSPPHRCTVRSSGVLDLQLVSTEW